MMVKVKQAEYIWLDGRVPTQRLRSKTRIIKDLGDSAKIADFPEWSYDGSSTYQAEGGNSDLILVPVNFITDPIRGEGNFLVMCEVMNEDGTPHKSNERAKLRATLEQGAGELEPHGLVSSRSMCFSKVVVQWVGQKMDIHHHKVLSTVALVRTKFTVVLWLKNTLSCVWMRAL